MTAELDIVDKSIEARKDEPKPPKKKKPAQKKEKQNQPSKSSDKDQDASAEDLFKMMIRKVQGRIGAIKFEKNGYQTLSEVQQQLDLLLFDTSKEINKIKTTVQNKFDRVQKVSEAKKNVEKSFERMRNKNGNSGQRR